MFPSSTKFHYPVLLLLADGKVHSRSEMIALEIEMLSISESDQTATTPKGVNKVTSWTSYAIADLKKAEYIIHTSDGKGYKITESGKAFIEAHKDGFVANDLDASEAYRKYKNKGEFKKNRKPRKKDKPQLANKDVHSDDNSETIETEPNKSLYVILEEAYRGINESLSDRLLEKVKLINAYSFERLVKDLIAKIMKVQSSKEAVVTQHSKDGGIDGYINADGFGIKKLCCFQAKKWDAAVGVKIVRELVGSLAEMKCDVGIVVTTSSFSKDAKDYNASGYKIILIDGKKLAELMIESGIGISERTYVVKDLDEAYLDKL